MGYLVRPIKVKARSVITPEQLVEIVRDRMSGDGSGGSDLTTISLKILCEFDAAKGHDVFAGIETQWEETV